MSELICKYCGNTFVVWPYRLKRGDAKVAYCSQNCYHTDMKGTPLSEKAHIGRDKWMSENKDHPRPWLRDFTGANNPRYKGDDVGYSGAHARIRPLLGPKACAQCGKTVGRIEASNKCRQYCSDPSDWWWLCVSCHRQYDARIRESLSEAVYLL
jgi:endogenous inhibitor of DNA gyrase (YacG/DUF329 family)